MYLSTHNGSFPAGLNGGKDLGGGRSIVAQPGPRVINSAQCVGRNGSSSIPKNATI